ncbi:Deoxyribonuclease TatD [hydrothermal vent metagenome]|uniref:Deoxyribonuclease TatD n=1 Tax=hydrothermal vent metagenome TaxID=652676 RepID=A0A3B0X190_9ZZZZ
MSSTKKQLIDIGVNLTAKSFKKDIPQVIERAQVAGVFRMGVTGTNLQHSDAAIELCEQYPEVLFSTAGIHPHHASEWDDKTAQEIHNMAQLNCVKAVGECGLDYNRNFSAPKDQRNAFEAQLELAADLQLPVFLHQRDAHKDFLNILSRWRDKLSGGVAHCFTGTVEEAQSYIELDLMIGITGWLCDERRGQNLQQAVKEIPLEHMMIETDAPYLLPRDLPENVSAPLRERRNEPRVLPHVCDALAKYKNLDAQFVAQHTTKQALAFFDL